MKTQSDDDTYHSNLDHMESERNHFPSPFPSLRSSKLHPQSLANPSNHFKPVPSDSSLCGITTSQKHLIQLKGQKQAPVLFEEHYESELTSSKNSDESLGEFQAE